METINARHLPIIDDGKLLGIVSVRDLALQPTHSGVSKKAAWLDTVARHGVENSTTAAVAEPSKLKVRSSPFAANQFSHLPTSDLTRRQNRRTSDQTLVSVALRRLSTMCTSARSRSRTTRSVRRRARTLISSCRQSHERARMLADLPIETSTSVVPGRVRGCMRGQPLSARQLRGAAAIGRAHCDGRSRWRRVVV